jgi:hypothetical protein
MNINRAEQRTASEAVLINSPLISLADLSALIMHLQVKLAQWAQMAAWLDAEAVLGVDTCF